MEQTLWFTRKFSKIDDSGLLPNILVRLESAPIYLKQKLWPIDEEDSEIKKDGKWSIKEELGHLIDLETLWFARVKELIALKTQLVSADLENQKTHQANHNQRMLSDLIEEFVNERSKLVDIFMHMTESQIEHEALHPRLRTPMKAVDLAYFVAEHDAHHMARIINLINTSTK